MSRKTKAPKRIAPAMHNTEKTTNADNFKEILEHLTHQLRPLYKDGVVPLMIREKELCALLSLSTSTLQKNRCLYLPGSEESPLPPYCKISGGGVLYCIVDIVKWVLRQSVGGGK